MNRSEFIDYLLEKGKCNRFDENQIDAIEQFCFVLYDNTELDKPAKRIAELEQELNNANHLLDNYDFVNSLNGKELEILKLEQQAKGVGAFEKLFSFHEPEKDGDIIYAEDAISYCARLREQAKQLKE